MKLLINESPLQIIPSLALAVGLNEAIVLQQIHFRSLLSLHIREGEKWVFKTYDEWKRDEFPFWSVDTIKRTILRLERRGYLVSTSEYNRMRMDKTKWYRIDYLALHALTMQNAPSLNAESVEEEGRIEQTTHSNLPLAITKEVKSIKKKPVENTLDVVSVIDYLNDKAKKQFNPNSKATIRLVEARYRDGYGLDEFKRVIDLKVKNWLHDAHWKSYLRPSTLFNATNFENYLEESRDKKAEEKVRVKPVELDFSKGEE
jgi:uncharacterized phage protein (TIGR02220 family)